MNATAWKVALDVARSVWPAWIVLVLVGGIECWSHSVEQEVATVLAAIAMGWITGLETILCLSAQRYREVLESGLQQAHKQCERNL